MAHLPSDRPGSEAVRYLPSTLATWQQKMLKIWLPPPPPDHALSARIADSANHSVPLHLSAQSIGPPNSCCRQRSVTLNPLHGRGQGCTTTISPYSLLQLLV